MEAKSPSGGTVVMAINPALVKTASSESSSGSTAGSGAGSAPGTSGASGQATQTKAMNQSELRQSLEKSGFQDVQVVRAAYVVAATTPSGERVALTISPLASEGGATQGTSPGGSGTSH